ncbi:MFS general substrate transporter [Colletotrichum scovillei]|uniref:MFS general substrate transporter n=1 Tax=Colletotrichum scovillei TaxID=1209932 RepID=UPI0015C2D6FA|nr:MFS general substrate transporter [Colletotrichum scovillei]KAF4772788.1 MFS general substrate transporter [Colletotrichum scovillei]KAG7038463.1 putative HC-toxin efflux carrier TOXA [Colletotrichum scovillei]
MEASKEIKPTEQAELASSSQPLDNNEKGETDENVLERHSSAALSEEPEYPGSAQVAVIMACILSAIFLMSLDRTIIATAIPRMTDEFHSIQDIGWYGSAFMVTTCCFQLLWGKVYTFYPAKYVFLALFGIFEIGSAICGAAPSSLVFIIGRAIAGMGSAGILSGAIVLMMGAVPLAKRPLYNGFFSAVLGTSSVVGPLLGGAFTSRVTWRWCFFINLPIGGAAMVVIFFALKPSPAAVPGLTVRQQLQKLDLLGELFLFPSLICLLLALQWGGITYDWNSWRVILLLVMFAVCLIVFIVVEVLRQENATIQLEVIKNRTVVSAMWYMFCLASTMLLLIYYLPIWFQVIKGKSAVDSGVATLPFVISLVVASTLSGQLVGRLGYYTPFTMLSSVLMPVGAGLLSTFKVNTGSGSWIGFQIILGFGIGLGLQHGPIAVQTVLQRKHIPMAVSLVFFCQQLGGAIFVSVGQNVLNSKLIEGLTDAVKDLDPQTIVNTGATALRDILPAADLPTVLVKYNEAIRWVFIVGTVTASLSALGSFTLEWKSVKGDEKPKSTRKDE